jgi:hypothetical protein
VPSTSPKQKRFMRIAAHDPEFAAKAGIDQKVAREFNRADQAVARRATIKRAMSRVKK